MMVAAGVAIICVCAFLVIAQYPRGKHLENHPLMTVAHRGGAGTAPENTLAAFRMGMEAGADALELDIHLSRDGYIMVMHDALLARTTKEVGAIADYTYEELKSFDAARLYQERERFGSQQIPTFEDVLQLIKSQTRPIQLQVEIKLNDKEERYEGIEEKLVAMLKAFDMIDRTTVISFDFPTLQTIQQLEPSLKLGALISNKLMVSIGNKGPTAVAKTLGDLKVDYAAVKYTYLSEKLYNALREEKLSIGAWTVNDAETMKKFLEMGVDFITSDYPSLLVQETAKLYKP